MNTAPTDLTYGRAVDLLVESIQRGKRSSDYSTVRDAADSLSIVAGMWIEDLETNIDRASNILKTEGNRP